MTHKAVWILIVGVFLLLSAIVLTWFGFTTNNPSPVPALSALALAIVSFILAMIMISKAVRGFRNMESTLLLRTLGTVVLVIGTVMTIYAAVAFFLVNVLPPNNADSRLPSLYLLFAGMAVLLAGTAVRNFRLR